MSELTIGEPTGIPDLTAAPDVAAAAPAPAPSPPPPAGWPLEAAVGIAKFPFAFLSERAVAVPLVGTVGGHPHWRLTDGEAELLAPAIKYYLDQVAPAGTPGQQLLIGLGIVVGTRVALDRAVAPAQERQTAPARAPEPAAPLPDWVAAQAPPPAPVTSNGREQSPTRSSFWAGSVATRPAS